MNDSESKAVAAAIEMFTRYGARRTSMSAIAEKADISRQTLYAIFSSKDKLLAAAMEAAISQIYVKLERDWEHCTSVDQVIDVYFKNAVIAPFELLKKTPDLEDLIRGTEPLTYKVAEKAEAHKKKLLTKQLQEYEHQPDAFKSNPKSVAHLIVVTGKQLKFSIKSRRELDQLLKTLKHAVLALFDN